MEGRKLRLMSDYHCFPLWEPTTFSNLDPKQLPISIGLAEELMQWAWMYDATLNNEDPSLSGFVDDHAEKAFVDQGRCLLRKLQAELPENYSVTYFNDEKPHGFLSDLGVVPTKNPDDFSL